MPRVAEHGNELRDDVIVRDRNRQSAKRRSRSRRASQDSFEITEHPLSSVDPDAMRAALLDIARKKIGEFPDLLERIRSIYRKSYPPHILAVLAGYGMLTGVSDEGVSGKSMLPKIEQHHIELMQALALNLSQSEWGEAPAHPQDIQEAIDTVASLADAFHRRRLLAVQDTTDIEQRVALGLREKLRMHTQIVRNWGYFSSVVRISRELYAPLDEPLRAHHGFSASDLITTAQGLLDFYERRADERFRTLRKVFREKTITRLVRQFCKLFPEFQAEPEAVLRSMPASASFDEVRARLLSHADIQLVSYACVTADAIATYVNLPASTVTKVLNALSLPHDALCGSDPEHLFLSNPVWSAPLMESGSEYFCPIPSAIFSHIHDVMRGLVDAARLKATLEERRATYLETKTAELLASALPGGQLWRNAKWRVGESIFETDVVAKLDRAIVIAEAKSASLTGRGLRGAADRVKRHVRELIQEPSEQSARLEQLIWAAKAGDEEASRVLAEFGNGFAEVDLVVRLSVTLDDFSTLSSSELELKAAGWIPQELQLACTINLSDFESAIEILDDPARFVHYFAEHQRLQKSLEVLAAEMDFLGLYLETGFNFSAIENQKVRLALVGMSRGIDRYFDSREAGVMLPKPQPKIRPYFQKLIAMIQARKAARWLSITVDLLRCADYKEQRRIEAALEQLKRKVERNWRDPEHECSLIVTPPPGREAAVMFHAYPPQLTARRRELAEELAGQALEMSGRSRCIMVGRCTARWSEPYSSVGIATKAR